MCGELVLEYQEWLNKILLILDTVCEGVVPAGKPDEAIYQRSRELAELVEENDFSRNAGEELLQQYLADGRGLLADFESDWYWRKTRMGIERDFCFLLRRRYGRQIAGSLQMLVNFTYFQDTCCRTEQSRKAKEQIENLFEIDSREEVKRVHTGVKVTGQQAAVSSKTQEPEYRRAI